jgi:hypothetical protein
MKSKAMVFLMSCMFLVAMAGNVLAVSDPTGDNLKANVDLLSASVVTSDKLAANQTPDTMHIGIKMAAGSHLPAAVIFDFDADNNPATGGGSVITGIPAGNCGSAPCKTPAGDGFDFYVVLVLRTQGDSSNLSLASGCGGSSLTCTTRGAAVSCDEGTCYELGSPCDIGDPNCYEIEEGGSCTNCGGGATAYPLANACGFSSEECDQRLLKSEYYVGYGSQNSVMVGNIPIRNTFNIEEETELCATLNWGFIVTQMYTRLLRDGVSNIFDPTYATDNPPRFQVSAFYDEVFDDEDDLFTLPGLNLDISDWLPNTDRVAAGEYNQYEACGHNTFGGYGNLNVDANDVGDFLNEFGRSVFSRPCPNCKN